MTALGWTLLAALYAIGLTHSIVEDRYQWKRLDIKWTWREIDRSQIAWPWMMLSKTIERLR